VLPPLGAREQAYKLELERDVRHLSTKVGERNAAKKWELADAADWIFAELEAAGYSARREGYEVDGVAAQNFEASVKGEGGNQEIVVIGAHYDTAPGSPGADDNASGVAAVLALARRFRTATPARTIRFVFFTNEEPPYFQTENMGSLVYARAVHERKENVVAMLSIESIGYFDDSPGSQKFPAGLSKSFPSVGNFIAVVGDRDSADLVTRVTQTLRGWSNVPTEGAALDARIPGVGWSDHWSFWQIQVPAVMITDTALFRNAHYHKPTDAAGTLDYDRMARVVAGLESVIADLTGDSTAPLPSRKAL
jgi:Zn-dependent M28 family amino/carboxypeptidase